MKKLGLVVASLLGLYALLGIFVAPRIIKSQLLKIIHEKTGLEAELGRVTVRPFSLSVRLLDFSLPDRRGERFASCRDLLINFELSSLWRGGYVFKKVRLWDPYLRFISRKDGTTNLDDVMPMESDSAAAATDTASAPVTVFIDQLEMFHAVMEYEDRDRPTPFAMRLDSLDLTLQDFATRPDDSGDYHFEAVTQKDESLKWRGQLSLFPLRSSGHLALGGFRARTAWEYIQDRFNFEITGGLVDMEADYVLDLSTAAGEFNVQNGSAQIRALSLLDRRDSSQAVVLATAAATGIEMEAMRSRLRIRSITADSGMAFGAYQTDSTFSLQTLFVPKVDSTETDTAAPWVATIDSVNVSRLNFILEDRNTEPVAHLEFLDSRLVLTDYVFGGLHRTAQLSAFTRLKDGGEISATGTYVPDPFDLQTATTVKDMALSPFQPYVNAVGKLELVSGTLSLSGDFGIRGEELYKTFDGDVTLSNLRAIDLVLSEDFLRWERLDVKKTHFSDEPPELSIAEVAMLRPYIRMIIAPDRTTNVQHIMGTVPDSAVAGDSLAVAEDAPPAPAPPAPADTTPVFPTQIHVLKLTDGTLNFSDFSMQPNFSVGIEELSGSITGLSSGPFDSATVEFDGKVDKYAPATIRGHINPLSDSSFTDLTMKFQSIELTSFSPYSGRFLGYKIDKGKLHLDLRYVLRGRMLESENKIIMDQLILGDKVESADAMGLPLKLAVALLKDSKGVIDLDVPVKGSLDDPQFSVMPIVWKILKNLIVKAVTSPFKLLGALFGGEDQDLEYVNFQPGSSALSPVESAKLDSLARALLERPGLKLDIRGATVPALDKDSLALRAVTARFQGAEPTFVPGALSKAQRDRLLADYKTSYNEDPYLLWPEKDPQGTKYPKEVREAEVQKAAFARFRADQKVSDEELRTLAQGRAMAIKDRIVLSGGVEEARVFMLDAKLDDEDVLGEIRLRLALDARE